MKEIHAHLHCPVCGAEYSLDGVEIGGLKLMTLPIHVRGKFESSETHNSMVLAESLSMPNTCTCSEALVRVNRATDNV